MVARPAAIVVRIHREAERGLAYVFTVHLDDAPGWDACDADCFHGGGLTNLWLYTRKSGWRGAPSEDEEAGGDGHGKQGMCPHA